MSRLGVCYQGSKNQIAKAIVATLPSADTFVDLFAGGCAVTHAAMISGKYKRFIANDFGRMPQVFLDAIHGAASDPKKWLKWVSHDRFMSEKAMSKEYRDIALMSIWSFGNNGTDYLYGKHIEPWKHALWRARVDGDFGGLAEFGIITDDASRIAVLRHHEDWGQKYVAWLKARHENNLRDAGQFVNFKTLANLQCLETLRALAQHETLSHVQGIKNLSLIYGDYRNVVIPTNAVVYCDPPYSGTDTRAYQNGLFDHATFWEWARTRDYPVYVSESAAPADFVPIWERQKRCIMRIYGCGYRTRRECVFVHKRFYEGSVK